MPSRLALHHDQNLTTTLNLHFLLNKTPYYHFAIKINLEDKLIINKRRETNHPHPVLLNWLDVHQVGLLHGSGAKTPGILGRDYLRRKLGRWGYRTHALFN